MTTVSFIPQRKPINTHTLGLPATSPRGTVGQKVRNLKSYFSHNEQHTFCLELEEKYPPSWIQSPTVRHGV